jgi:NAD(P)-dependent dehydrogenase (short-subunit alcohol dehydrogenase family)
MFASTPWGFVFTNAAPGLQAVPRWSAYAASKAALRELADSLRKEEARHGLRVTTIYPGGTAPGGTGVGAAGFEPATPRL